MNSLTDMHRFVFTAVPLEPELMRQVADALDEVADEPHASAQLRVLIEMPGTAQPLSAGQVQALCRVLSRGGRQELVQELHEQIRKVGG